MRKTLLLFTTMALALLLAAGMAWAAQGPTVMSTAPTNGAVNVDVNANITATFSQAMNAKSINTNTFYLLPGHLTAQSQTKNPKRFCATLPVPPSTTPVPLAACPAVIPATVSYDALTKIATLNPTSPLLADTKYTAVVEGTGDGDMVAVKNTGGTPMLIPLTGDYIFHFTTAGTGSIGRG